MLPIGGREPRILAARERGHMTTRASDNTGAPQVHRASDRERSTETKAATKTHGAERLAGVPKVTPGGSGFSGLGPSASLRKVPLQRRRRARFLGTDNEVCHAWLVGALQQLHPEGQTKVVGYLEAILEEIGFEMKVPPGSCP